MLYDIPVEVPEATIAVITSPAPFAIASRVTPAKASENSSQLLLYYKILLNYLQNIILISKILIFILL